MALDARGDVRAASQHQRNRTAARTTSAAAAVRLTKTDTSTPSTQSTIRGRVMSAKELSTSLQGRDVVPTYSADDLSPNLTTAGPPGNASELSSSTVGIAVGIAVGAVVLVLICLAIALLLIRRRRKTRRDKKIVRVENPQYKPSATGNEEVTLGVGPTGIVKYSGGKQNGSRKRRDAPAPPIYRPSADTTSNRSWDSLTKRTAPAPPRNLNVELYEKDSPASSLENLKSVDNKTAAVASPVDDSKDLQTSASHRQPLLPSSPADASVEPTKPTTPESTASALAISPRASAPAAETDAVDDDVATSDVTTSLIGNASSHASLDSYDRSKNPFFAD